MDFVLKYTGKPLEKSCFSCSSIRLSVNKFKQNYNSADKYYLDTYYLEFAHKQL